MPPSSHLPLLPNSWSSVLSGARPPGLVRLPIPLPSLSSVAPGCVSMLYPRPVTVPKLWDRSSSCYAIPLPTRKAGYESSCYQPLPSPSTDIHAPGVVLLHVKVQYDLEWGCLLAYCSRICPLPLRAVTRDAVMILTHESAS